jgi:hypothetical protein
LRRRDDALGDGPKSESEHVLHADYAVVADEDRIEAHVDEHDALRRDFDDAGEWSLEQYLDRAFGRS